MAASSMGARARAGSAAKGRAPKFTYPVELAPESELPNVPVTPSAPQFRPPGGHVQAFRKLRHPATAPPKRSPQLQKSTPPLPDDSPWRSRCRSSTLPRRQTPVTPRASVGPWTAGGDRGRNSREPLTADWEPAARAMWRRLDALQDAAAEARAREQQEARQQEANCAAAGLLAEARRRVQEERRRNLALRAAALQRKPPPAEHVLEAWMAREETRLSELEHLAQLRAQKLLEEAGGGYILKKRPVPGSPCAVRRRPPHRCTRSPPPVPA